MKRERIHKLQRSFWDLEPLFNNCLPPLPKETIQCPVCGSKFICVSEYLIFHRTALGVELNEYRIDVKFKCMKCGHVFTCCIHITADEYNYLIRKCGNHKGYWNFGHVCTEDLYGLEERSDKYAES